jgi:hypothetical protein
MIRPAIAYYDATNADPKLIPCNEPNCVFSRARRP